MDGSFLTVFTSEIDAITDPVNGDVLYEALRA
jgi:hypothetical protein